MKHPFTEKLLAWYAENGRTLPWRGTTDPYRIWVSEIILQQTRVAQGYDYYCRFVERFPDVQSLAAAHEDEVMRYWQGLGYYSRARNLHAAAREVVRLGGMPRTYEGVRKLKGVGDYTAAAICSIAYGLPYAVVDGNVYRVLARWMGIEEPIDSTAGKKLFAQLAQELLDPQQPSRYNQAIMDFGALQCTPTAPDCLFCPLNDSCVALHTGKVDRLPVKEKKTKVTHRYFHYFFVRAADYTFIYKRGPGDIWQHLYELPLVETDGPVEEGRLLESEAYRRLVDGVQVLSVRQVAAEVKHVLSHRVIHASCHELLIPPGSRLNGDFLKVSTADLQNFAVPRLVSHFFSLILTQNP